MEITNFKQHMQGEKILATFDLYLGPQWGITYKRIKLMRGKNGPFLAMPSYSEEVDGVKRYLPFIEMSKEKKAVFDGKVFDLLRGYFPNGLS